MTTSGTVGRTVISTASLLEHAWRRCGLLPSTQVPELVKLAKESLYMMLMHLANRGLNLWCVERRNIGLEVGQVTYDLPVGTNDLLNHNFCQHTLASTAASSTATSSTVSLTELTRIMRLGVKFSTAPTVSFFIESSVDGSTWTTQQTITDIPLVGDWAWYDLDPTVEALYFRVRSATPLVTSEFEVVSASTDLELSRMNRDDYASQPVKTSLSETITNVFFEKRRTPTVTVWPAPSVDTHMLQVWVHRQIQDVGALTEEIEVPARWLDSVVMQFSYRCAIELPGVDPTRRAELAGVMEQFSISADNNETDSAPVSIVPNIGCYTQ